VLATEEVRGGEGIWDGSKNAENSGIGEQDDGSHAGVDDDEKSGKGVAPPGVEACSDDSCS